MKVLIDVEAIRLVAPSRKLPEGKTPRVEILNCIHITYDHIVATDGYSLIVARNDAPSYWLKDSPLNLYLDKTQLTALKKFNAAAELDTETNILTDGERSIVVKIYTDGVFPSWQAVWPASKSEDQRIGAFNPEILGRFAHLGTLVLTPVGQSTYKRPIFQVNAEGNDKARGILMGISDGSEPDIGWPTRQPTAAATVVA